MRDSNTWTLTPRRGYLARRGLRRSRYRVWVGWVAIFYALGLVTGFVFALGLVAWWAL